MNPWQQDVLEFTRDVAKQHIPSEPTLDGYPFELRARLILEEALEFVEACGLMLANSYSGLTLDLKNYQLRRVLEPDLVEMMDAVADINYVSIGAAVAAGVDIDAVHAEVHRSNMAKANGPISATGKLMKPDGWTPPDVAGVLKRLKAQAKRGP